MYYALPWWSAWGGTHSQNDIVFLRKHLRVVIICFYKWFIEINGHVLLKAKLNRKFWFQRFVIWRYNNFMITHYQSITISRWRPFIVKFEIQFFPWVELCLPDCKFPKFAFWKMVETGSIPYRIILMNLSFGNDFVIELFAHNL